MLPPPAFIVVSQSPATPNIPPPHGPEPFPCAGVKPTCGGFIGGLIVTIPAGTPVIDVVKFPWPQLLLFWLEFIPA